MKNGKYTVILCKNDIFKLDRDFSPQMFDLVFNSLFRHHLNAVEKDKIAVISKKIAKKVMEYDGYRNWPAFIPQSIVGWKFPIFLNAVIFSNLRYSEKNEIEITKEDWRISFFRKIGFYLREHP